MKKAVVGVISSLLFLTGTAVFAQIEKVYEVTRGMQELQAAVERSVAAHRVAMPSLQVQVPAGVTSLGRVSLQAALPINMMPALQNTLSQFRNTVVTPEVTSLNMQGDWQNTELWLLNQWVAKGGKGFYEGPDALAQDLDAFYKGFQAADTFEEYESVLGEVVRFYPLPVSGILYRPSGFNRPIILSSDEYFVIYNPATKAGQVAHQNFSLLKMLYKPLEK